MKQSNVKKQCESSAKQGSLLREKRVAIIGGGPGGLTLARLLQMRGAHVVVYEREASPHARIQGSSLDLHPESGRKAIQVAGLEEAFWRVARPEGETHTILDKHGVIQLRIPQIKVLSSKPEIDRGDLRDILVNSLVPGTIHWDHHFLELTETGGSTCELTFQGREKALAELVIGADGVHSKVRPYITSTRPTYAGVTLIQMEVAHPEVQCPQTFQWVNGGNLFALGDKKGIMGQQKSDGSFVIYATAEHPEDWIITSGIDFTSAPAVKAYLKDFFADWNPEFLHLFDVATDFAVRPLYGTAVDQHWETRHNMTMLGDAAHVMPPFAGVGVNMAMQDALELADCLTNGDYVTIPHALENYEQMMLTRTAKAQRKTMKQQVMFHEQDALEQLLKKLLSPLTPVRWLVPTAINAFNGMTGWIKSAQNGERQGRRPPQPGLQAFPGGSRESLR